MFNEIISRYPSLSSCSRDIQLMFEALVSCFENGGRLYVCGNGGSAADALHIVGELVKEFVLKRAVDTDFSVRLKELFPSEADELLSGLQGALPAFALVENTALATAFANDADAGFVFAQQVYGYTRKGDAVLGVSTSGNSVNVVRALMAAKGRGAITLGLTGVGGGKMKSLCDVCICVPETETYKIQEMHLPVYHALCLALEKHFWGGGN